ncbi:hypothetical protein B0H13DRAFT_2026421 [Mycena leptocephala]|nr:hypothetical protein B0H13DRAFT_2026421 [Mycena leptocephala]
MDLKCDNVNCPATPPSKLLVCSGCFTANYCSKGCQAACWSSHKQACKLHGVRLRVSGENNDDSDEELDGDLDTSNIYAARKKLEIKIEHTQAEKTVDIGYIKIQRIDILKTRLIGFFDCLDEYSHELGNAADFQNERYLVYIQELVIEQAWRGKGVGTWVLPRLFDLVVLKGARYIFTWPTVMSHLEPPLVNGLFGDPTPAEEAAWLMKRDRIIRFYQKVGFRRLANSFFFCLAKNTSHPSHSVPIEEDAPLEKLPPPDTEEEERRRDMAYR